MTKSIINIENIENPLLDDDSLNEWYKEIFRKFNEGA